MDGKDWLYEAEGNLRAEGVSLAEIAARYGTPCYVYSAARIRENLHRFYRAFRGLPLELHYAVKANPLGAILRLLAREGLGAEVVSGGELLRALRAGFPPEKIIFTGVGKTEAELGLALERGIKVVVESLGELYLLEEAAGKRHTPAPIALRLNPALSPRTHPHLATGKEGTKFGLDPGDTAEALDRLHRTKALRLVGLHLHLGSQLREAAPYISAWEYLLEVHREARERGFALEFLDLGGGFGIPYEGSGGAFPLERLAAAIRDTIPPGISLVLEPGRALVGDAGLLLARVLYIKEVHGRRYVVVDAGMNDLLRPALYGARHRIVPVRVRPGERKKADVVGPICENADVLAVGCELPPLEPGDLLVIRDVGAYGASMSSQYNSRPRAAEVLILGGKAYLVRRRETVEDLVRGEIIPEGL